MTDEREVMDEIWHDMMEAIPIMRQAVRKALEKDIETFDHGIQRQRKERTGLRRSFEILRKKWIVDIIYAIHLFGRPFFNDLHGKLPEINTRTLSNRLDEMEALGMVTRNVKTGKPIRVFYELTDFGRGIYELLIPLLSFFSMYCPKWSVE